MSRSASGAGIRCVGQEKQENRDVSYGACVVAVVVIETWGLPGCWVPRKFLGGQKRALIVDSRVVVDGRNMSARMALEANATDDERWCLRKDDPVQHRSGGGR